MVPVMEESGGQIGARAAGERFAEGYVEADGFRVRYLEAGEGPPLIHLHGAGGVRLNRTHDLLAERFRLIAFEVPGFGESAPNDRSRSMAELAESMARAATALGLDRYSLIGTSFGGTLALWLAVQHPDRLDALVLESPTAILPESRARPHAALDLELEGRLAGLAVPTLVLLGTLDRVVPPATGSLYREKLGNGHLVLVYDAGHAIGADRPEAFTRLVADFLERREQFVVSRASSLVYP